MKRIKVAIIALFVLGMLGATVTESLGYPPFLRNAKRFGAKDCTFCHVSPDGGEPFNDRGKWLITERQRRNAEVVDPEWLAEYKPADKSTDKSPKEDRKNTVGQELTDRLTEWFEAAKKNDQNKLKELLADGFIGSNESGQLLRKTEYLAGVTDLRIDSYSFHEVVAQQYGEMAILVFRLILKGTSQGKDLSGEYRETDVWINKDGKWQIAAKHVSPAASR